jgi:predicted homoserine dehydrogenase-like protein
MIDVIIDQGYMVSFGSSRLLAWIHKKKHVLLLLIMDAKRETILVPLSFDHSLLKAIITPLYTFR